jgi:multiple sugar transport system substrate-binding protein
MKSWHKKLLSVVLVLTLMISLAACGSNTAKEGNVDSTPSTSQSSSAPDDTKKEPVEIIYWGDWGGEGQKQFETMMEAFNNSQDRIRATYVVTQDMVTKFLTAASSGQAPDIMFWDRWRTVLYAPKDVLYPINDFMARDNVKVEDFYTEAVRELSYNGNIYGLPLTVDARALFYNKKFFAEAGITTPPRTWDELNEAAKKLTIWNGDKLERSGMSMQDVGLFSMWIRQAGGQMLTDDGTKTAFNSEAGLKVLNFWKKMVMEDKVYKVGFESGLDKGTDAFATGKVAMLYSGPWMLSTYKNYGKDLEFGIVPPPAGPDGHKGAGLGGFGLVIPAAAKHKEEAWELMKWWLATPENAAMYCKTSLNIPGLKAATLDSFFSGDELYKPFLETFEFATIRPPVSGYSIMEEKALIPNLQLFMEGKQSAEETLQKAQEMGDKILAENANP